MVGGGGNNTIDYIVIYDRQTASECPEADRIGGPSSSAVVVSSSPPAAAAAPLDECMDGDNQRFWGPDEEGNRIINSGGGMCAEFKCDLLKKSKSNFSSTCLLFWPSVLLRKLLCI